MLDINGYKIALLLHSGKMFNVYRGMRLRDEHAVILKVCRSDQPSDYEITNLSHEYQILTQLESPFIVGCYDMIKHHQQSILVLDDIGGIDLKQYCGGQALSLTIFFKLALQMCRALHVLHTDYVIHKDINPNNIIVEPVSLKVQIIDFNIASKLSQEVQESTQIQNLEGTLSYISPEQTGRVNRLVDYRSDFYSLGVTFYEMLTGHVPFATEDPLELVYHHLAVIPDPIDSDIPLVVGDIIAKLLAKNVEERYLSATGLIDDLTRCQEQWQASQDIEHFVIGQHDYSDRLTLSQKLYGRDAQISRLLEAFDSVSQGHKDIVFVSGYSGIGKTSLIKELYKPITRQRGYFISGKYDQLQRTEPYSAFIGAFQDLMHRLLTEPQERLHALKEVFIEALGNNAQVIIDVIPTLGLIMGPQAPAPMLMPQESQNRFLMTFQNFIRTLAKPDHPLVIFLDDMQWMDSASFQLLSSILSDPNSHHLLIIGAYRDNEVTADHPLRVFQQNLEKTASITDIKLTPLDQDTIQHMLADSLNCPYPQTEALAILLLTKTEGNPYFINEVLKKLYHDRILRFDHSDHRWQWDMVQIEQQAMTTNVVDLLTQRIGALPEATIAALKLAACIGFSFDLQTLAMLSQQSLETTAQVLWPAVEINLLQPIGEHAHNVTRLNADSKIDPSQQIIYRFNHDRIQQSAYQLIDPDQRPALHLNLGRLFIEDQTFNEHHDRLFEILNHFNQGLILITDPDERLQIATANLWAGQKAKAATAYPIARDYLNMGVELLPTNSWHDHYQLTFDIYKELANTHYLTAQFDQAEECFNLLLKHAQTVLDKVEVYKIKITILGIHDKYQEVIDIGLRCLELLGIKTPRHISKFHILKMIFKIKLTLKFQSIEKVKIYPAVNPNYLAVMQIYELIAAPVSFINRNLYAFNSVQIIYLILKNGYTQDSPMAYIRYAMLLMHSLNRYQEALEFIKAENVMQISFDTVAQKSIIDPENFLLPVIPWSFKLEEGQERLIKIYQH